MITFSEISSKKLGPEAPEGASKDGDNLWKKRKANRVVKNERETAQILNGQKHVDESSRVYSRSEMVPECCRQPEWSLENKS